MNIIYNEDCISTMDRDELKSAVDVVITSPPYNTSRVGASDKYGSRYDMFKDNKSDAEYIQWTLDVFNGYDKILKPNGCILYNISYSSENTYLMWLVIAEIIKNSNFVVSDDIIWKKRSALPNNRSKNKLTRIVEHVFVICRKSEIKTFNSNKKITSYIERTGQANYENVYNFIDAPNNDGKNDLNKATFSTELVTKLMDLFVPPNSVVYDSFMGVGTTAKACIINGHKYIGSELSKDQVEYANNVLKELAEKHDTEIEVTNLQNDMFLEPSPIETILNNQDDITVYVKNDESNELTNTVKIYVTIDDNNVTVSDTKGFKLTEIATKFSSYETGINEFGMFKGFKHLVHKLKQYHESNGLDVEVEYGELE